MAFQGFSEETYNFFRDIRFHNDRGYMDANRARYTQNVRIPCVELAAALAPYVLTVDDQLDVRPERAVSRINRDTRFSKNKAPYRDHMWIGYKHSGERNSECFGLYMEIREDSWCFGMGFYQNSMKEPMDKLRQQILAKPGVFAEAAEKAAAFQLLGEDYKRGYYAELPPIALQYYRKKAFFVEQRHMNGGVDLTPRLADVIGEGFLQLKPLYDFVMASIV